MVSLVYNRSGQPTSFKKKCIYDAFRMENNVGRVSLDLFVWKHLVSLDSFGYLIFVFKKENIHFPFYRIRSKPASVFFILIPKASIYNTTNHLPLLYT